MGLTRPKYTNLDTSKFEIGDPIVEINTNVSDASANNSDIGFIFNRGTTGNNVGILWDKTASRFILVETVEDGDSEGNLTFTQYADLWTRNFRSETLQYNRSVNLGTNFDLDTLAESGFYDLQITDNAVGHGPYTGWWYITSQRHTNDNGYYKQEATTLTVNPPETYVRCEVANAWTPWVKTSNVSGATGTFTTVDSKTVTVTNGVITAIV